MFVVNDDSYISEMQQNYYLYNQNDTISILPWDYNLAFGGFESQAAKDVINRSIYELNIEEKRPLFDLILNNPELLESYETKNSILANEYLDHFQKTMPLERLRSSMKQDPRL